MQKGLFEYLFGVSRKKIPENIILTPFFSPKRFESYREIVTTFKGALYSGALLRTQGKDFGIIRCGIGAGIAGDSVIGLGQTVAKNLIFFGSAGGLNNVKVGDIIIADSAYNGEGFSGYHKKIAGFETLVKTSDRVGSDPVLSDTIEQRIKEKITCTDIVKKGKIFTIGSLTAETEENLIKLERMGFLGVEMELSAVLQASKKIGTSTAGVLFVSDEPLNKPVWKELKKEDRQKCNRSVEIIIKNITDLFTL